MTGAMKHVRQMVEATRSHNEISFDEAVRRTRETLMLLGADKIPLLDMVVAEHRAQAAEAQKLSEKSTAFIRDAESVGWYVPHTKPGGVWEGLRGRMSGSGLAAALPSIDESSDAVLSQLAQPNVVADKRRGLVIGNVQSGKTANYAAVIAKAVDAGYRMVIVMAGVHSNLRQQTQGRLERDLGVQGDGSDWFRLTSTDGDIGRAEIRNAGTVVGHSKRVLAVVKKNTTRLTNLRDLLRAVDPSTLKNCPILIIDDESDQATPDSSTDKTIEPSAINRLMRAIWEAVGNGTYVGYTATPFANVLMNPNDSGELYPKNFITALPTPENYFGAERLFGRDGDATADPPDVLRFIDQDELGDLVPATGRDVEPFDPQVTKSLASAIRWFIIAAAVRRVRRQRDKHSTMLIHTTHKTEPHFQLQEAVVRFLEPLKAAALDGKVDDFYGTFHEEMNRAAGLYSGDGPAPTWPVVAEEIPNVLRTLKVSVDNSDPRADRLDYSREPQTVIVIGGGTLSRGLTLEGLFVSFFCRSSNTYDTLLQMGRWFGYRAGYEDLQRIWVSPGLDSDYRFLASVEAEMREEIERMTAQHQTPSQVGVRIQQHPGRLEITSKTKMKHANFAVDFEARRLQTVRFDREALSSPATAVRCFLEQVRHFHHNDRSSSVLFRDVPSALVVDFLQEFHVHPPKHAKIVAEAAVWAREKLPDTPWNVVLAGGTGDESFKVGDIEVKTVVRAPLARKPGAGSERQDEIDIRALMASGDLISDLRILGRVGDRGEDPGSNNDQLELRASKAGADGRGLLVLYPISRTSGRSEKGSLRRPMAKALREIDPALTQEGGAVDPIFGIGLVAPTDTQGVIREKGTFVAVEPEYSDPDDVEERIVDHEKDYEGSGRR